MTSKSWFHSPESLCRYLCHKLTDAETNPCPLARVQVLAKPYKSLNMWTNCWAFVGARLLTVKTGVLRRTFNIAGGKNEIMYMKHGAQVTGREA